MTKFRIVRAFDSKSRPSGEREYKVETAEKLTFKEGMQLMRDLGSPYQGVYDMPNWVPEEPELPIQGQVINTVDELDMLFHADANVVVVNAEGSVLQNLYGGWTSPAYRYQLASEAAHSVFGPQFTVLHVKPVER